MVLRDMLLRRMDAQKKRLPLHRGGRLFVGKMLARGWRMYGSAGGAEEEGVWRWEAVLRGRNGTQFSVGYAFPIRE